jgi:hypothetical protein
VAAAEEAEARFSILENHELKFMIKENQPILHLKTLQVYKVQKKKS